VAVTEPIQRFRWTAAWNEPTAPDLQGLIESGSARKGDGKWLEAAERVRVQVHLSYLIVICGQPAFEHASERGEIKINPPLFLTPNKMSFPHCTSFTSYTKPYATVGTGFSTTWWQINASNFINYGINIILWEGSSKRENIQINKAACLADIIATGQRNLTWRPTRSQRSSSFNGYWIRLFIKSEIKLLRKEGESVKMKNTGP